MSLTFLSGAAQNVDRVLLSPVPLTDEGDGKIRWIHLASTGRYAGYQGIPGGFTFERATFETIRDNLRSDPRFRAGDDGFGAAKVIPFDYEHASEMSPTEGSIPLSGVPAPAWLLDVDVRDSDAGRVELWGRVWLGDQVREQIRKSEYRFVSVAVQRDGLHPESGERTGAFLTSVAFTNDPFLRMLAPLAASRRATNQTSAGDSMEFDIKKLAAVLGVSDSTESAILLAAEQASTAADRLRAILQAVGVEDVEGAIAKIAELMDSAAKLRDLAPELDELRSFQQKTVEAEIESDVEAALAAHRLPADMADMLRLFRRQMPEQFKEKYPRARVSETQLSQTVASAPGGTQVVANASRTRALPPTNDDGHHLDVSAYAGANVTEKTIACLKATQAGFSDLSWDKQVKQAALFRRSGRVAA